MASQVKQAPELLVCLFERPSECGAQTSNVSITWVLVRNAGSQAPSQTTWLRNSGGGGQQGVLTGLSGDAKFGNHGHIPSVWKRPFFKVKTGRNWNEKITYKLVNRGREAELSTRGAKQRTEEASRSFLIWWVPKIKSSHRTHLLPLSSKIK